MTPYPGSSLPVTMYVDELIGPATVNTMPKATLEVRLDQGRVARRLDPGLAEARTQLADLATKVGR